MQKVILGILIFGFSAFGCAHRPIQCLHAANQAEMLCLQNNRRAPVDISTNVTVQAGLLNFHHDSQIRQCKLLYKLTYRDCVLTERARRIR